MKKIKDKRKFRIIFLGAGFSKPAGLPLASELWDELLKRSDTLSGRAEKFHSDIEKYIAFKNNCDGLDLKKESINFEEFIGFLDIEHFLGLRGSDTWSVDGNEGQVVIKTLIGEILTQYMPSPKDIPDIYLEFASKLQPQDHVITFNYDVLLERSLDVIGKPYRLFPNRYQTIGRYVSTIDSSKDEVIILKLHGSIDWFDKSGYIESEEAYRQQGLTTSPSHPVFNADRDFGLKKVLDGPRQVNDPLNNMYKVAEIENLYRNNFMFLATPWILSPSTNKIIYASPLEEFWNGMGRSGSTNFGMAIIGYSLPGHDMYARQAIYSLINNYQSANWGGEFFGYRKTPLILVDYKKSEEDVRQYKSAYRFVDKDKTVYCLNGFNREAIKNIFDWAD